ncbi:SDR family NAD(P)-dependent oxidoreductase [Alteromonas sp. KUL49]|uniref:SDR family NAD(P)-dependent oxidoreductase n=1 Tax=Alteromonas sp. KUL49 TaxID=2480798 RepID=UPI00102F1885|nr:SDR family NAD(P)-dependent oxidoreductase [Alteromonas sp. KUL49]TAP40192.1 SDR family NAD(P)-dependent oxidoreductase [Alteromonas sp. KUL49]GEA11318.1 oxidoreductase [Alteromonas sp. KUL49]
MKKSILLTGATDGIGLETAKKLAKQGQHLLLHGRNTDKLAQLKTSLQAQYPQVTIETYDADLSDLKHVKRMVTALKSRHDKLDVIVNNAGVFKVNQTITQDGMDVRFVVNTIAPYLLTTSLLPILGANSRVVNLSSAAQAPVNLEAMQHNINLSDSSAYAQSKLAITMWTFYLATTLRATSNSSDVPSFIAVNPASFLGSKMVKDAYGTEGKDISIGADILVRLATDPSFEGITGRYFDNDYGDWAAPHPDALNENKNKDLVGVIEQILAPLTV